MHWPNIRDPIRGLKCKSLEFINHRNTSIIRASFITKTNPNNSTSIKSCTTTSVVRPFTQSSICIHRKRNNILDTIYPALKPSRLLMQDVSTNYIRKVSHYQAEKKMHNNKTNCLQQQRCHMLV